MSIERTVESGRSAALARLLAVLLPVAPAAAMGSAMTPVPQDAPPAVAPGGADDEGTAADERRVRFSFKNESWENVLDFFSRATGLPIVREVAAPSGNVTYIYPESYALPEALETLNILLQTQGVMLRRESDRLFLQKLDDMKRENIPTFIGQLPETITDDQVVTVLMPLVNAQAQNVAEQIANLVASYGSVTPMPRQNALLIVETAAQIRRIQSILDEIDREDVENIIEFIAVRNAPATELVKSLTSLMGQRVVKFVVDAKGKQVKVEDEELPGLTLTADERTNAIIARGTRSKLDQLKEAIELLDVAKGGVDGGRSMRTIDLDRADPASTKKRLDELYGALPKEGRPTVVALPETRRVTIVGAADAVKEGVDLVAAIEGLDSGDAGSPRGERSIEALPLEHAAPEALLASLRPLMQPRLARGLVVVAGPDGESLLISGTPDDVRAVRSVVATLDRPMPLERTVRFMRIVDENADELIATAERIFTTERPAGEEAAAISIDFDRASRRLVLTGVEPAVSRFEQALERARATVEPVRETRRIAVTAAKPSRIAPRLAQLVTRILDPRDGTRYAPPEIEALDELDELVVTASPDEFATITSLLRSLDRVTAADRLFRVIQLNSARGDELLSEARAVYARLVAGTDDTSEPSVEFDAAAGALRLEGAPERVALFERSLEEARRLLPPDREGRLFRLREARAADVKPRLETLVATTASSAGARRLEPVGIEVVEALNALYVSGEPLQLQAVAEFMRDLDVIESTELPPLRLIQVRAAEVGQISQLLSERYEARTADERRAKPVRVSADPATNTLVVAAHESIYSEISDFVDQINAAGETQPERETLIFPLRLARARDVAQALERLYPEPPMPRDTRSRPLPHLQKPREVLVSADEGTNTLIIEAPAERKQSFETLVAQLDRVELPPQASLRTWRIERGDVEQVARTLGELAARGVLATPDADGSKPVEVTIQVEPESRTLIVAGDEAVFERVEQILDDLQAVPPQRSLRVFEVGTGDAATIAERAQRLYAEQTAGDPTAGEVQVEIDAAAGTILAVAEDESMFRFAAILAQLEAAQAPPPDVRIVPLTYADAAESVALLESMLTETPGMALGAGPAPVFQAIEETNSILVAASPTQHQIVESLVERLDVRRGEMPPVRILQLRTTDAQALARALEATYAERPIEARATKPARISADPETNALIVSAHPELMDEIAGIVQELNDTNRLDASDREIRIFPLKVARAEELARTIDEMFPEPPVPRDSRGRPRYELQEPREIVVRADRQTNSLIVDAPVARMAGFDELVKQLDRAKIEAETEVRTWKFANADLDAIGRTLRELAASGGLNSEDGRDATIVVSTEPVSGTLVVSAPSASFARIESVISSLEAGRPIPETTVRFFRLNSARADSLAPMLREVLLGQIAADGGAVEVESLLRVTADRKTNTLVVQAPQSLMSLAEELVTQLDDGTSAIGEPTVRVRPLVFGDATAIAASLQQALPTVVSKATGDPLDVRLVAAGGANAIIMVGLAVDLDEVESLVEPLDARPANDAVDAATFELAHADAALVAPIVERLLSDRQANDPRFIIEQIRRSRGAFVPAPTIRVEADARTNSLIVSGPQQTVVLARTLIEELDRPGRAGERIVRLFSPSRAQAPALAQTAERVLANSTSAGARATVVFDEATGAIVISGAEVEVERTLGLLNEWDAATPESPQIDLRVIQVESGDAAVLADSVRALVTDSDRWPASLQSLRRAGIAVAQPTVTADAATNRLLISAPSELAAMAADLVAQLDRPRGDGGMQEVRVYDLASAGAEDVAGALTQAMAARARTRPGEFAATIVAEPSGNAIVVSGDAEQQREIAALVNALDAGTRRGGRAVRTVFLEHARAEQVAPVVEDLLVEQDELDDPLLPGWMRREISARRAMEGGDEARLRVAADTRLNAVVIAGPLDAIAIAEETIRGLDERAGSEMASDTRSVRVLPLRYADASALADSLGELFAEGEGGEEPPLVRLDPASGALLIRASAAQHERIASLAREIDRAAMSGAREIRTLPIDPARGDAADIAEMLRRLLERDGGEAVEVVPFDELLKRYGDAGERALEPARDARSSATSPRPIERERIALPGAHALATMILAAAPAAPMFANVVEPNAPATSELAWLSQDDADAAATDDEPHAGIVIAVDPATNSLIILGSPRAVERATMLANEATALMPAPASRLRAIPLPESLDPGRVRTLLDQTLRTMTPAGGARGDLADRVGLVVDETSRTLLVTATDRDFDVVGRILASIAREPVGDAVATKVYPLANISADRANLIMRGLLGFDARGRGGSEPIEFADLDGTLDPTELRMVSDGLQNALIVIAPPASIAVVDRLVALVDQEPVTDSNALRLFELKHARSGDIRQSLASLFQARSRGLDRAGVRIAAPEIVADERTNTLLVTASAEQMDEVADLIVMLDRPTAATQSPLVVIELQTAQAEQVARLVDQLIVGEDAVRRANSVVIPDASSNLLLVRAADETVAAIRDLVTEVDRDATSLFPVRSIVLERADAGAVAEAIQRFYEDRARVAAGARGARRGGSVSRRISVIGDERTSTLLIAASDDDFAEIETLVARFDSPEATAALEFRVFQLTHVRPDDIRDTIQETVEQLVWGMGNFDTSDERFALTSVPRLNSIVVTGSGDTFDTVERLLAALDVPGGVGERVVRLYRVDGIDPDLVANAARSALGIGENRRWWEPADPSEPVIETDDDAGMLFVTASEDDQAVIAGTIALFEETMASDDRATDVIGLEYAPAGEVARTLQSFLRDRDRRGGGGGDVSIVASETANTLIVAAGTETMMLVKDLVSRIDQPDTAGERQIEIVPLSRGDAQEIARLVEQQFPTRGAQQGVRVSADVRTNALIISAPRIQYEQVAALVARLDSPPAREETLIRTYPLEKAQAEDVLGVLRESLALDGEGRTTGATVRVDGTDGPAVEVVARIVADDRSNTLIVTATQESFGVIESLLAKLESAPSASPVEYRIIPLKHVEARDITLSLDLMFRNRDAAARPNFDWTSDNALVVSATVDQFADIERVVADLDQPSAMPRRTDFLPLRFAKAEQVQEALSFFYGPFAFDADDPAARNVRIVADPATNSLVISADEEQWQGIRALLEKLDAEEYDNSLQLRVLPLAYADASSVAQAINDAFRGQMERGRNRDDGRGGGGSRDARDGRDEREAPTVLVSADEWVSAAAEEVTNSVVVSANRENIEKIEQIVKQLDVADFAKLPQPRLIVVAGGSPTRLAESLSRLYEQQTGRRARRGALGVRIVPDEASGTIIVRAEEAEFDQIRALAESLQSQAATQGLAVRVLPLESAPAERVAEAIREAYAARAEQAGVALSLEVDRAGNALVIAATPSLYEEIAATAAEMDRLQPSASQAIFIIELENIPADSIESVIERIGLNREQRGGARIVSEPIRTVVLPGRNAVLVVANPADRDNIVALFKSLDDDPAVAQSEVRFVTLRNADASAVARAIESLLEPQGGPSGSALAESVRESIRRLRIQRGADQPPLDLDLSVPIRVLPSTTVNALIVSSDAANVETIVELAGMLDALPIGENTMVRLFPLENIAADQFVRIVRDLYAQGAELGSPPGGRVETVPGGLIGEALSRPIAISTDTRTNTVIVAGAEDAIAFVEVLYERLDSELATGWVETRVLTLEHADAEELADTIDEVLVQGMAQVPSAAALQQQVARLRVGADGAASDDALFVPLNRLVVRADASMNALVLVGTPGNLGVIEDLVALLDVEAASPGALVRVYPVENATAARIATVIENVFEQQVRNGVLREEDGVRIIPDERTNALIVSTTARSFGMLEPLLETLDQRVDLDMDEVTIVPVNNGSAARVASIVQRIMDARVERLRETQPETADFEQVLVLADERSNGLVVAAGPESLATVRSLIADLDAAPQAMDGAVSVLPIRRGSLEQVAEAIDALMDRRYAGLSDEVARSRRPLVITDARTTSLLVAADPDDMATIEDLVATIEDTPTNPAIGLHVVTVDRGDVEQLAPRIEELMQDRLDSLGDARTPSDRVTVTADPASRSLLVAATEGNLEVVRDLLAVLVEAGDGVVGIDDVEILSLVNQAAREVVPVLRELYVDIENDRRGIESIRVTADERLNAIIVSAPPSDREAIRGLLAQLDESRPATVVEIRYIPLSSANALETVSLIENVLSGNSLGGRRSAQLATVVRYLQQIAGEDGELLDPTQLETEVSASIREAISLVPDVRTNTVIVRAPSESMELIVQMIRDLDGSSLGSQKIKVFKLQNADAEAMAEILSDLFNLRQQGSLYVLKPREPNPGDGGLAGGAGAVGAVSDGAVGSAFGTDLTLVPDDRQALSITVDNRTNSLLVSATPSYLELVDQVVLELDAQDANTRDTFVYPLRNAQAADVAQVVGDFVAQDQQKILDTLTDDQLPSASRLLEREVTIVGDGKSNSVLVNASPRYREKVMEMIRSLDVDPPQVMIQVMLAEITLDDDDELGVTVNGQVGVLPVSASFGFAGGILGGSPVTGSFTINSGDLQVVLAAMQSQGRFQLLSNPSVTVANNEDGFIQVGQTVRLPESISTFDTGSQSSAVVPEDIGVILRVRPSINPDGYVRLAIEPEISRLSETDFTELSETFRSPIIIRRTAQTTVTVRDGETVVIGGLITEDFERRDMKIPFFGDIPLVGPLFRSERETTRKTELLIAVTPHVISGGADAMAQRYRELSDDQINRLSVPEELLDQLRRGELSGDSVLMRQRDGVPDPIFGGTRGGSRVEEAAIDRDERAPTSGAAGTGGDGGGSSTDADYREIPNTTGGSGRE